MMEKKLFESAIGKLREIIEGDKRFRYNTYLVGGCVRDLLLGETPKDIDLCVDYPEGNTVFIDYLKDKYSRNVISGFNIFERYGTSRFTLHLPDGDVDIECVIPRVESYNLGPRKPDQVSQTNITEDAMRRDFCCNAIYKNLETGEYLDPTGKGIDDIEKRILRTPLEPVQTFKDDPLRMLRAIRFSCTKGFEIEENTLKGIDYYCEYDNLSFERIQEEFNKILMSPKAEEGIRLMIDTKLIYRCIPEFVRYRDFEQHSKYHSMTWLEHTLSVFRIVVLNNPKASLELRLASLLHDISKPECFQKKPDGQYSFHGHEEASAKRSKVILKNLKYPNSVIDKVFFLVKYHMILKQFYSQETMRYTGKPKNTRKIVNILGNNLEEELELIEADNMSHSLKYNIKGQVESFKEELENLKIDSSQEIKSPVTGVDIMSWFNVSPGKLIKEIKDAIQDIYEEDPFLEKEELKDKYIQKYGKSIQLWFARVNKDTYWLFSKKPIKKDHTWQCEGEYPVEIKSSEINYIKILDNELITENPIYYPKIFKYYCKKISIRTLTIKLNETLRSDNLVNSIDSLTLTFSKDSLSVKYRFLDGETMNEII